jgi:hypothetical protein
MMEAADAISGRIPDPALRQRAIEGSEEPVSVLIELALPEQGIEYEEKQRHGESPRPLRVASPTKREQKEIERTTAEAKRFLEELLDESPVYFHSAQGFAATVTGRQLREIASRPFIKSIAPNRRLRS